MPYTDIGYCEEFRDALLKYLSEPAGSPLSNNWFGRLLAHSYHLDLKGLTLGEIELKDRLDKEVLQLEITSILITKSDISDKVSAPVTVSGIMGISMNGADPINYNFTHTLKWTLQARHTTISI